MGAILRHAQLVIVLIIAVHTIFSVCNSHLFLRRFQSKNSYKIQSAVLETSYDVVANNEHSTTTSTSSEDIKIIAFTDSHYVALAKVWYKRLSSLGYTEHYIVCVDEKSYKKLSIEDNNYRLIQRYIIDPDYARPIVGFSRQLYSLRLQFTLEMLQDGTHVLLTDLDNIFNTYVPLVRFLEEQTDIIHAYEMKYPTNLYQQNGFVVCAGHQFLRASPATIAYLRDEVLGDCFKVNNCDDQVRYNIALSNLQMRWDPEPTGDDRLKISSNNPENDGLLVEGLTGSALLANDTLRIKIWERNFAWRLRANDIPEKCPPKDTNWVAMPTVTDEHVGDKRMNKVWKKIEMFRVWDDLCRGIPRDNTSVI